MRGWRGGVASAVILALLALPGMQAQAENLPWIDVHFHFTMDDASTTQELAEKSLAFMQAENIRTLVVSSQPKPRPTGSDFLEVMQALAPYGKRFAVLGGGNSVNSVMHLLYEKETGAEGLERFRALVAKTATSGVKGFGEIALHHISLNDQHAYELIPADDALVRIIVDAAAEHDLVLDIHFDAVLAAMARPEQLKSPNNPATFEPNFEAFERLLAYNRKAKIVWAHAGGNDPLGNFRPALAQQMLEKHPNLYMSLRPSAGGSGGRGPRAQQAGPISAEWMAVVEKYADRFVIGSDSFLVADSAKMVGAARIFSARSADVRRRVQEMLQSFKPDVARKVGYENAERLYKLN